jgi:glutamate-1-semialdehyde 2,1-aminomutase
MGNGAVILGHRHPEVTEAVRRVLERGLTCGLETDLAVEAAERFTAMFPTPVHVRFATTGTEAALHAVQMARAITGRRRIAKVEGGYHGWADELQVSAFPDSAAAGPPHAPLPVAGSSGTPSDVARNVVVLPFNQLEATVAIIEEYHTELAAVIVEPVLIDIGFVPPVARYLETLREATARHGILLIFDEILTGFRLARGGAQERFDVAPDLAITGKAMSNGFPLSAVYGRPDVMDIVSPGRLAYSGTFNGHAVSLAAACATLARLQDGGIIAELDRTTRELMAAFGHLAEHTGIPVRMQGGGGHFQIYFTDTPVVDYRTAVGGRTDRYRAFMTDLLQQGVSVMTSSVGHHALSAAHNREAIDTLLWACESALKRLAEA